MFSGLNIFGSIVDGIKDHFKGKQEIKAVELAGKIAVMKAKQNAEIAVSEAKITMAKSGQANDFDLDRLAMQDMKNSYKDEIVLAIFLVPMIMAFIPGYANDALAGFKVIAQMPEWYRYIIIGMVVVIYGMRGMLTKFLDGKKLPSMGK